MRKNSLYKSESQVYRILHQQEDNLLVIDCIKMTMPVWIPITDRSLILCGDAVNGCIPF